MHYGVYLSIVGEYSSPSLLAELAHEAEGEGWEGVFIFDHVGKPSSAVDPWVALAAMALRTKQVRLGPIVTPVARRRPWKLARETVSLDQLSNGRLTLGVGLGWSPEEFEAFGESGDPKVRAQKLDEGLAILAGLWSGQPYSYSGTHYQIRDAQFLPQPVQVPRIPVWVCGAWPDARAPFRRAARWDGVIAILNPNLNRAITPQEVRDIHAYIEQRRTSRGPFDVVVILWTEGDGTAEEHDALAAYAEAGVTWMLEDLTTERYSTLLEARGRLRKGPPGR